MPCPRTQRHLARSGNRTNNLLITTQPSDYLKIPIITFWSFYLPIPMLCRYYRIPSNRSSHIYFLQSDYSMVICVANSHCLQKVRRPTGRSEFASRTAHSAAKFVFYKSQPLRGKWLRKFSAPFCAYASFINETPDLGAAIDSHCTRKKQTITIIWYKKIKNLLNVTMFFIKPFCEMFYLTVLIDNLKEIHK